MEKKYLIICNSEGSIGAFENVTEFNKEVIDTGHEKITFKSDEGNFTYLRGSSGYFERIDTNPPCSLIDSLPKFNHYKYFGRRTFLKYADLYGVKVKDDRRRNKNNENII